MNSFTFDGVSSETYGVIVSGTRLFDSPERDVEYLEIPGRNGALILDNGRWRDVEMVYPCLILDTFEEMFPRFRAWIMSRKGRYVLSDTYDPETFRMAHFVGGLAPETAIRKTAGRFDVRFSCHPQKWLYSGRTSYEFTSAGSMDNPTAYDAAPLIEVTISSGGSGTLTVGNQTVAINNSTVTKLTIDCERQDAYAGGVTVNELLTLTTGEFPTMGPGRNNVTMTGDISKVKIVPRWWTL